MSLFENRSIREFGENGDDGIQSQSRYTPSPGNSVFEAIRAAFPSPEPRAYTSDYFSEAFHQVALPQPTISPRENHYRRARKRHAKKIRKKVHRGRKEKKAGKIHARRVERNYKRSIKEGCPVIEKPWGIDSEDSFEGRFATEREVADFQSISSEKSWLDRVVAPSK